MSINRKFLLAGVAAAAVAAVAAHAIADPGHGRGGMGHGRGAGGEHGMMGGQRGAGMGQHDPAERLAAAKTDLGIRAEQTAAWDAYAKVVTETSAERRAQREKIDRDAVHAMKPEDRQAFRESMMKQREELRAKVKVAAETLVAALDDAQKAKAQASLPGLAVNAQGRGQRHGMAGGHSRGQGHGGHGGGHGEGQGPRWMR